MGPESPRTLIPDEDIAGDHLVDYAHNAPPVFLGHYWMEGEPASLAENMPAWITVLRGPAVNWSPIAGAANADYFNRASSASSAWKAGIAEDGCYGHGIHGKTRKEITHVNNFFL